MKNKIKNKNHLHESSLFQSLKVGRLGLVWHSIMSGTRGLSRYTVVSAFTASHFPSHVMGQENGCCLALCSRSRWACPRPLRVCSTGSTSPFCNAHYQSVALRWCSASGEATKCSFYSFSWAICPTENQLSY